MRKSFFPILIGTNGTGKTTFINKMIHVAENAGRRCLVVTPDPVEWTHLPEIYAHEVRSFTGTCRIIYEPGLFHVILASFNSGFLILDDFKSFNIPKKDHEVLHKIVIRRRQKMYDIAIAVHGFTEVVPLFLYSFATHFVIFKTVDNITRVLHTMPEPARMKEIVQRVQTQAIKDPHYKEVVNI